MPDHFNEPQISRILAGVSYIDKLLTDVEEIVTYTTSNAFPKYKNPLSPAQVRVVRDYIERLRQQITNVLRDLSVSLPPPKFDSTHSIRVNLQFVEVALEELAPKRLTGYGEVPGALRNRLEGGLQEMKGIVRQLDSYLAVPPEADLAKRIARLQSGGSSAPLLGAMSDVIDRHRLVEFRTALAQLLDKLEHPAYEIAFFGRVSAGKSSLLNWLVGRDLLPTGVTPVTSVPTRIRNGNRSRVLVTTGDGRLQEYEIDHLPDFVTEARNPGNIKRVVKVLVELPIDAVPEDVVLVDTPGLGSLALAGAAETLAYLPRCDVGVVLIDASSNLHSDDVMTIDALRAASADAIVVLSKSDLVSPADLHDLLGYTRTQIEDQLHIPVSVSGVSTRPEQTSTIRAWVETELKPRILNGRALAAQSNYRKALKLGQAVLHALEASQKSTDRSSAGSEALRSAERTLREAAGLPETRTEECYSRTAALRTVREQAVETIAGVIATGRSMEANGSNPGPPVKIAVSIAQSAAEDVFNTVRGTAIALDQALQKASTALEIAEAPLSTLESLVTNLPPPPEFSGCSITFTKPVLGHFSSVLAKSVLQNRIARRCGAELSAFFESYARVLELWFRNVLLNVEREFNATAEIYRAQLLRLLTSESIDTEDSGLGLSITTLRKALQVQGSPDEVSASTVDA